MDDSFEKLKSEGQNNVDNLVKWIKDSKIVENTKAGEDKAKELFEDVRDKSNVELEKFKSVLAKLAEEQKKSIEDLSKKLSDEGPKLLNAVKAAMEAGVSALKDAMKNVDYEKPYTFQQKNNMEDFAKKLNEEAPKVLNALKVGARSALDAGVSAFKDAMKK